MPPSVPIEDIRSQFPLLSNEKIVFLNSSFQQPMNLIVSSTIEGYLRESLYELNPKPKWNRECEEVRAKVAQFINAEPEDLVFTRDATESSNLFQRSLKFKPGDNVVLLRGDHPSIIAGWVGLIPEGLEIRFVEMDVSEPYPCDASTFIDTVDENTIAISLSSVMFQSGLRNDIKSICEAYRPRGIHVLVDATQEIGFGKIDVKDLGVSALVSSVQKGLSCPTGLGLLYVDPVALPELKSTPPIVSAASFSYLEEGTNIPIPYQCVETAQRFEHPNKALVLCLALGKYLDYINAVGIEHIQEFLENLSSYLRLKLNTAGVRTLGPDDKKLRSPHSNVLALNSPEWLQFFTENNVIVSQNKVGVRVSLGAYNSKHDVDKFLTIVQRGLDAGLR